MQKKITKLLSTSNKMKRIATLLGYSLNDYLKIREFSQVLSPGHYETGTMKF